MCRGLDLCAGVEGADLRAPAQYLGSALSDERRPDPDWITKIDGMFNNLTKAITNAAYPPLPAPLIPLDDVSMLTDEQINEVVDMDTGAPGAAAPGAARAGGQGSLQLELPQGSSWEEFVTVRDAAAGREIAPPTGRRGFLSERQPPVNPRIDKQYTKKGHPAYTNASEGITGISPAGTCSTWTSTTTSATAVQARRREGPGGVLLTRDSVNKGGRTARASTCSRCRSLRTATASALLRRPARRLGVDVRAAPLAFTLRDGAPLTKGEFQTLLEDLTTALERVVIALFLHGVNVFAKGAPGQVDEFPPLEQHAGEGHDAHVRRRQGDRRHRAAAARGYEEPLGDGAR